MHTERGTEQMSTSWDRPKQKKGENRKRGRATAFLLLPVGPLHFFLPLRLERRCGLGWRRVNIDCSCFSCVPGAKNVDVEH